MTSLKIYGKNPTGKRLERIQHSANYKNGVFTNLWPTATMAPDNSFFKTFRSFLNKPKDVAPQGKIPSVKTDLKTEKTYKPAITWFGHSSYLVQLNGKNILVDPVFSDHASPVSFMIKAFEGANAYRAADMPVIDLLILTHDHYDHLDYKTLLELQPKIRQIYCSLGVGSHLEYWGFDMQGVVEFDWWDTHDLDPMLRVTATPARHFTGRGLKRAKTLWSSFVLQTEEYTLFLGGDSGYGEHFKMIGEKFGPFDLAILESGQYNTAWPEIHMAPEQTVQAAVDLDARVLLPVHWGKFSLALHPWDEPIKRVLRKADELKVQITTPMIGESVILDTLYPESRWWETVAAS